MSDEDRMDRAERIRDMREGRRPGDEAEDAGETDETSTAEEATADAGGESNVTDEAGTPDPDGDVADPNGEAADSDGEAADPDGDAVDPSEPAAPDEDRLAEVNEAVSAAVERVAGASAEMPGPEDVDDLAADLPAEATEGDVSETVDPDSPAEVGAAARAGIAAGESSTEPETRVLEFTLDDEQFCLDIEYIEEIVKREGITRVPNTAEFVEGVVDLRGQITTILNPKVVIGTDDRSPGDLLVVFDSEEFDEQGHIGWVVDDVRQVSPVADEDVNDPPVEGDHIEGVIDRGDGEDFVVWTSPDLALDEAT
jgi:purine-binding chemotaxis protein CheW